MRKSSFRHVIFGYACKKIGTFHNAPTNQKTKTPNESIHKARFTTCQKSNSHNVCTIPSIVLTAPTTTTISSAPSTTAESWITQPITNIKTANALSIVLPYFSIIVSIAINFSAIYNFMRPKSSFRSIFFKEIFVSRTQLPFRVKFSAHYFCSTSKKIGRLFLPPDQS